MDISIITGGLNPAQKKAVEAVDGPFLVVAGAGSGKTTVLSRRVAALIAAGVDPQSILLLTFTRVAAANMVDRAKRLVPEAAAVTGGTFHSVAHLLMQENQALFGYAESPTFLDPDDVKAVFKKIASNRGGKSENFPTGTILAKVHSFSVNTKSSIEDVVYDRFEEYSHMIEFFEVCSKDYKAYKKDRAVIDYDDLLVAWDMMMDNPAVGDRVRKRFQYVMVDEDQDSNAIQCSIVAKLGSGPNSNVMVVGDPAQAIYGFRGSSPGTMFEFLKRFPLVNVINLETNYRSTEEILDVANAVDHSMLQRFERTLLPAPGSIGGMPSLISVPDHSSEAKYIAEKVLERKSQGIELCEQAILVRSTHQSRHIEAELTRRKIPYKISGGIKINEAAHIKDMMCLIRTAVNPLDEPAWTRVLTMASGIGPKKAAAVYTKIVKAQNDLFFNPATIAESECKKSPDIIPILESYKILRSGGPAVEIIERSIENLEDIFMKRYPDDWRARKNDISAVTGIAEGHPSLDSFLASMSLDYSIDKKAEVVGSTNTEAPMTLSTIHSAKGLEWDVVYIPSFYNGHLPSQFVNGIDEMEEEKRVFYVAVTRPRKILEFIKPVVTRGSSGRPSTLTPESPFEGLISDYLENQRYGSFYEQRQSYSFGVSDVYIDIYG